LKAFQIHLDRRVARLLLPLEGL